MRKNSIKNTRVNEAVRQELSALISREVKDPRVDMMTTVTRVNVATDLKTCKVYISVLGDAQKKEETMAGLKSSEGFLRRMLAKNLNLRNTPELTFILDESIEYGIRMSKLIDGLEYSRQMSDMMGGSQDSAQMAQFLTGLDISEIAGAEEYLAEMEAAMEDDGEADYSDCGLMPPGAKDEEDR